MLLDEKSEKEETIGNCGKRNIKKGRKLGGREIEDLRRECEFRNNLQVILIFILVALWWWKNQFQPPQHLHRAPPRMPKKTAQSKRESWPCLVWSRNDSTLPNGKIQKRCRLKALPFEERCLAIQVKDAQLVREIKNSYKRVEKIEEENEWESPFSTSKSKGFPKSIKVQLA